MDFHTLKFDIHKILQDLIQVGTFGMPSPCFSVVSYKIIHRIMFSVR